MPIFGTILFGTAVILIFVWFGTRKKMTEEGTWEEQGGAGAYGWLIIYAVLAVLGLWLGLKP